ncbi:MAG: hypothetical protein H6704_04830 [Myxococcales bacterium]|nr:hypothetical protein [Myxococcales bacterium]
MGGDPGMGGAPMPIDELRGDVFFIETITAGAQFPTLEGGAEFGHYTRAPIPAAAVDQAGDCFLFDGAAADPGQFTAVSAGDVSLTGGAEDVTMAYDDFVDAYALDPFGPIDLWSDGDTVTVGADGSDDFGAFSTVLPAPEALAGVEPAAGDPYSRAGTTVRWTPGSGTAVVVQLRAGGNLVECTSADDGSVDIPAAAFAWLDGEDDAIVNIRRLSQASIMSDAPTGSVEISLQAVWASPGTPLGD